jgi:threonine synthase
MSEITYFSTNFNSPPVSFKEAILQGQAPDKGLYMPSRIPKVTPEDLASMKDMTYSEIAFSVSNKFLQGEIPEEELRRIANEAYDFDIPLEHVAGNRYIMRLDKGPTASFKDFAARMMSREMQYFTEKENKNLTILTATSGDTGSAVANAFYGLDNINVVILYPKNEVTKRQEKQMTTLGKNIFALGINGKFDPAQKMVKRAFADPDLKNLNLSSANSINFGRLKPQAVYYFYAHSRLADSRKMTYSVPCGNFGDLTGGLIAQKMGLPVEKFIAAVNKNDEFPRFLENGIYQPIKPSIACISNAMNVGDPSNLARIVTMYGGRMDENGTIHKAPDMERMREDIFSVSISEEGTRKAIRDVYEEHKKILEPHGAVAWAGLEDYLSKNETSSVCVSLETADPAKFPEEIEKAIGIRPKIPESLMGLEEKKEYTHFIEADYEEFKRFLKKQF